jgi:hypothetical protein
MLIFEKMKMNATTLLYLIDYWLRLNLLILAPGPGTTPRCAAAAAAAAALFTASCLLFITAAILTTARFTATGIFATFAAD